MRNSGARKSALISTSHIARQDLTIRVQTRRVTGDSFCRVHHTLRVALAMAANLEREIWGLDRLVA
jgi:hypothetical protein